MAKIAFLGAGSLGFGPKLIGDILTHAELAAGELHLVDPHAERIELMGRLARKLVADNSLPTRIEAMTSPEAALDGADYVICSIRSGTDHEGSDALVPLEVGGCKQTVADTVGIGGIMKGLRTIPAMLDIAYGMEQYCPDALMLNYTNPMAMIMWAVSEGSTVANVGLCHSVQGTSRQLAGYLGVDYEQLRWQVWGINHLAWFTELSLDGEDLYPKLHACLDNPEIFAKDPVRFEILKHFGYFVTESSRHMTEYVPYFLRDDDEIERLKVEWRSAERIEKFYEHRSKRDEQLREKTEQGIELKRSYEYGAQIIHAIETNQPTVIHGNVANTGLIPNLPEGCCVEVPCLIDGTGLHPCAVDALPEQCAGLCQSNVTMQGLVVKAVLEGDREAAIHAAMQDPNTMAQMNLTQIREAMNRLLDAQADCIPSWS